MLKILKEGLDLGLNLLEEFERCPNSHNCLWLRRAELFKIPGLLPKDCQKENCSIIIFRETLEADSPAFYAETLRLSEFNYVARVTYVLAKNGKKARKKKLRKLTRIIYNLHIFGQLVIIALYPLLLETKEVPFLKPKEIEELGDAYHLKEIRQTIKKMGKINQEWLEWIDSVAGNLISNQTYPIAVIYLVYLFLKGLEKTQLPEMKKMSKEEKKEFFSEIEKSISRK